MHGPPSTLVPPWDGVNGYWTIPYVDSVLPTLTKLSQRRTWKRARTRALRLWAEAGDLVFDKVVPISTPIYDVNSPNYPYWDSDTHEMHGDEDAFMRSLLVRGAMHLLPMYENWIGSGVPATGWMFDTGSFAVFNMNKFFSDDPKYVLCHEMGHAIGLGHQYETRGGYKTSVMWVSAAGYRGSSNEPDDHDRLSLRAYYV